MNYTPTSFESRRVFDLQVPLLKHKAFEQYRHSRLTIDSMVQERSIQAIQAWAEDSLVLSNEFAFLNWSYSRRRKGQESLFCSVSRGEGWCLR